MTDFRLFTFDLAQVERALPPNWTVHVHALADECGVDTALSGTSATSRESVDQPFACSVVTGDFIRRKQPWLDELYRTTLLHLAIDAFQRRLYPAVDVRSGVNINVLRSPAAGYERHVDSNPVTGVLFATTHLSDAALVFETVNGEVRLQPAAGLFAVFDATTTVHWVEPLTTTPLRISIPMNYYGSDTEQTRPEGLDAYLYGACDDEP